MFELMDLLKKTEGILSEEEKRELNWDRSDDSEIRAKAKSLMEMDMVKSINFVPLSRLQDRRDLYPNQGKESDADLIFSFESLGEAQDLYDFVTNTGMLEPGEVKLKSISGQHNVIFMSHVLVMKPDVVQAVMMGAQDDIAYESIDAFNVVAEDIATVLREREGCMKKKKGKKDPKKVKLTFVDAANESGDLEIRVLQSFNESETRAPKRKLYTRYWDGIHSVAEDIVRVIKKLPNRGDITKEDAAAIIRAVDFLSDSAGMVIEAEQVTPE